jgi:hypothetical protein
LSAQPPRGGRLMAWARQKKPRASAILSIDFQYVYAFSNFNEKYIRYRCKTFLSKLV